MTGIRHFWSFLTFFNLQHDAFPVSPDLLLFFITWLFLAVTGRGRAFDGSSRGACASTIIGYVSAVRSFYIDLGFPIQAFNDPRVARMKRAVKRLRTRATRARLPVTVVLVARLLHTLPSISALGPDSIMIAAVLCVGVYGLLRSGEMVSKSESASAPLLRAHVAWDTAISPPWVDLFIPASKTDYMRTGSYVRLWRNNSATCPFSRLLAAWDAATDKRPTAPLFQDSKGTALSYTWLQKVLRSLVRAVGLDPSLYSSHSLRIGGATSLAMACVSADEIKLIGRWSSVSYQLYVRLSNDSWQVASASARMGALGSAAICSFSAGGVLGGGLSVSQVLRWSSDDVDDIAARFSGQGGFSPTHVVPLALSGGAFHDCEPRLHDFSRPCLASSFQRCLSFLHQLSTGDYFQFDFPFSLAGRFSASSLCGRGLLAAPFASLHSSSS
eukprot:g58411.t1